MRRSLTSRLLLLEEALGYFPVQVTSNLLDQLQTLENGILVISLIFRVIKTSLAGISVLIIYSLLIVSVESKNFEFAVIRMVGLSKSGIIGLIIAQSFVYVVPAVLCAFSLCTYILIRAKSYFSEVYKIEIEAFPDFFSTAQALFIGVVIPLISSILPIRVSLGWNLTDALDVQRSKTRALYISISRRGSTNNAFYIMTGTLLVGAAFALYYLLPYSMITMDLTLASFLFFLLLLIVLLAFSSLSTLLIPKLNLLVVNIMLCFESQSTRLLLLKNMVAHKDRNLMSSLLLTLTLAAIIFVKVSAMVPVAMVRADVLKESSYSTISIGIKNVPVDTIDSIVKKHEDKFVAWGYFTNWVDYGGEGESVAKSRIHNTQFSDLAGRKALDVGVVGVTPFLSDGFHSDFQ